MKEIELSTMIPGEWLDLAGFEEQNFIQTRYRQMDWDTGWSNVLQIGLYLKGPDISEVGSTWLENLTDMRALRPFNTYEIHALGGDMAFLPSAWRRDATVPVTPNAAPQRPVSIPWLADTRLIYYRKDVLARAGIAEEGAFASADALYDTLSRLQAAGIAYPLGLSTGGLTIHNIASWIWGRGGQFRSADYRKITLVEPEARRGMLDYFRMHRFIDPATYGAGYTETNALFFGGNAPVMVNGQWAMKYIKDRDARVDPAVMDTVGYAPPPGVPFVGSTHLVIWRHSLHEQEAVQLIAHLTSPKVLGKIFRESGNFPARLEALNAAPFAGDPDYQLVVDCLRGGRSFRSARLWAGVEMRLNTLFDQLWGDLFANPNLDLETEIESRVASLSSRLEKTLLANW